MLVRGRLRRLRRLPFVHNQAPSSAIETAFQARA